jgi:replication factor A1
MNLVDEIIAKVSKKSGLSREEILDKIKQKKDELSGLVSEEGAAYIVANELGVETKNRIIDANLKVKDVSLDMRSVNVVGRVKELYGVREFESKGRRGKVANLEIMDDTGSIRIVLWNVSDIEKVENNQVKKGDVVRIENGYVKEGYRGGVEINLGNKGRLNEEPEDVNEDELPKVVEGGAGGVGKLSDIQPNTPYGFAGKVLRKFDIRTFEKADRSGKVGAMIVADDSGSRRFVLWNEKTDLMDKINVGDVLKVDSAYAKQGLNDIELQANWATKIEINPAGVEVEAKDMPQGNSNSERIKIAELKDGDTYKELRAAVVNTYDNEMVYDMCPNCNKRVDNGTCGKCGTVTPNKLLIINAMIDDGSGTIRAAFFRDAAENLVGMKTDEVAADKEKAQAKLKELLGKEMVFEGRVKNNENMGRLEFTAFSVRDVNPAAEAEKIVNEMEGEK